MVTFFGFEENSAEKRNIFCIVNRKWTISFQVVSLLYVCQLLVAFLWTKKVDPDYAAIPYLTALGDLSGTFLLFVIFTLLSWFNKGQNSQ